MRQPDFIANYPSAANGPSNQEGAPNPFPPGSGAGPRYAPGNYQTHKEHLRLALAVTCAAVRKILRCSADIPYLSVGLSFPRVQSYAIFSNPPNIFGKIFGILQN